MMGVYGAAAAPTEVKHRVARYDPAHGSDKVPKYTKLTHHRRWTSFTSETLSLNNLHIRPVVVI